MNSTIAVHAAIALILIHMAYSFRNPSDGIIKHYLETSKIIAVVGTREASARGFRQLEFDVIEGKERDGKRKMRDIFRSVVDGKF